MKQAVLSLACAAASLASVCAVAIANPGENDPCGRGWVFFDLGHTLLDSADSNHIRYKPEARENLLKLRELGFHLALISNVPDTWGPDVEAKLAYLKEFVSKGWDSPEPLDWTSFEAILLPPTELDRKPAPFLFNQARRLEPYCQIAYESQDPAEVNAARLAGFDQVFVVGSAESGGYYLPPDHIFHSP